MAITINGTDGLTSDNGALKLDGTTLVVDDTNNRVGIGTSSPDRKLTVVTPTAGASVGSNAVVFSDFATATMELKQSTTENQWYSNTALTLAAGGSERMRIDSSGRITMPYQPVFAAKKNTNQNLSGGATADISFGSAIVNIGSYYNTTTSKFTAPIAGTYFFSFQTAVAFNSASYFSLVPLKNGSALGNYAAFNNSNGGTGYQSTATSFIITLAANDYINCELQQDNNATIDNAGMFCGYLIG